MRYVITWGMGGPEKTYQSDNWKDAKDCFNMMKAWGSVWLNPAGEWAQNEKGKWVWSTGYGYKPLPPVTISGLREVTRHDYWSDLTKPGETVRVLFEGEEYALEARGGGSWFVWQSEDLDWIFATVNCGKSGEYYAGFIGWENNVPGNIYDTLHTLKHEKVSQ